jgi:hypothetical protein
MENYRFYLKIGRNIRAGEWFSAHDDGNAQEVGAFVWYYCCKEHYDSFEVWRGVNMVYSSSSQPASKIKIAANRYREELINAARRSARARCEAVCALEERLERSYTALANSRRILDTVSFFQKVDS